MLSDMNLSILSTRLLVFYPTCGTLGLPKMISKFYTKNFYNVLSKEGRWSIKYDLKGVDNH